MAGFLGSGRVYVDRKINGVFKGHKYVGNTTKFEIKENTEKKERISKDHSNYGSAIDTVYIKKPADVNISLDDLDIDNLALVFMGNASAVSVSAGAVTDEAQTANPGSILITNQRNISAVVITDDTGATTYVLGTDYEITDAKVGLIKILTSGSITEGQAVLVDYSHADFTSNKVEGGTNSSIIMRVLFEGVNQVNQQKSVVKVFQAILAPTTGVDFKADDFTTIELAGTANVPEGKTAAYEVETDVEYA